MQAAYNATAEIPILGTSVTEYGVALGIDNFSGTVGGNVSGTSDLAPLTEQADMILELLPETKTVGLLYCSAEPNSEYQVQVVEEYLTGKGITCTRYSFSDSNDVAAVTTKAAADSDVIYIPTDNTAASCTETIGSIELDGVNVSSLPEYKRARYLGRVYQDPMMGTSAGMEIEENLALAERRGRHHTLRPGIRRGEREDYRRRLRELGLGLEDRLTTKVGTLSGGQRQALTLLMATLQKPKLLLLDEHTAALDPQTAQRVMDITDRLVRENHLTALMITHNMRDAIHYGNRLLMLHNGRIVLDISGEEKARLTVPDLLALFSKVSGQEYDNDRALLA